AALGLDRTDSPRHRRWLLGLSMASNLAILGFFKYFNFFLDSLQTSVAALGIALPTVELQIVLPVGISFYTFQSMSYTIDVYRRQLPATKNLIDFLAYIAFFPQLVAGPI